MRIGLTGGVGSGKSTVAGLLAEHGAVVIDADAIAREVVEPGTPGLAAIVERFGEAVLRSDGSLDRAALAARVFDDETELAALNAIVHPLVAERSAQLAATAPAGCVVVHDIPLLVENGLAGGFDLVVVVVAPESIRLARLAARGMAEADARARMARQPGDARRRAVADELIVNDAGLDGLRAQVERLWQRLQRAPNPSA